MVWHLGSSPLQQTLKGMQLLLSGASASAPHAAPGTQGGGARPVHACPVLCIKLALILEQPCPVHVSLACELVLPAHPRLICDTCLEFNYLADATRRANAVVRQCRLRAHHTAEWCLGLAQFVMP